ncbi:hypothetical protein TNCV_3311561 [Trichonephila clavipes]|nr:hypothetical protein TNCV_3311561 [Trichonephila clavipes]
MRNVKKKRYLSVPTDDVVSRVFIEFSALEQVVAIHPGIAAERSGLVSSQVIAVELYSPKKIRWLGKSWQQPLLSPGASGLRQRCTLNLSRAETFSRWCGVVVWRGGAGSGVVHVT